MKPPVPKYFVIKSILQGRFDRDCAPGDKLPSIVIWITMKRSLK